MRNYFAKCLLEEAAKDERIWLLTGDLGFTVLEPFAEKFPDRYVNVGVAEQNLAGIAAGLALSGKMPFIYSIANFPILRCLEQVRNDIAYHDLNVRIVSVGGGMAYGSAGYTHHGVEDLAIMRSLCGMNVLAPGDPVETGLCVEYLTQQHKGPAFLRLGKGGEPTIHTHKPVFEAGKPVLVREGEKVALVTTGAILAQANEACEALAGEGLKPALFSMPMVSPIDEGAWINALSAFNHVFLIEEHLGSSAFGALYEQVLLQLAASGINITRLNLPDSVREIIGSREYLLAHAGLDSQGISNTIRAKTSLPNTPAADKKKHAAN